MKYCETGILDPLPGLPIEAIQENADKCRAWYLSDKITRSAGDVDNRVHFESYHTIASLYRAANQHNEPLAFCGATESMEYFWPKLKEMEDQMIIQIISGEKPIAYFDEFVMNWKNSGGDIITAEVNELLRR